MPSYLRYGVGAVGLVVVLVVAFAPLASMLVDAWSQRDLELRSKLLFNSIKDYAALQLAEGHGEQLGAFLERLTEDEKLLALGYCDERGVLRFATKLMPASFSCEALARADTATFSIVESGVGRTLVAAFPIDVRNARGHLAVLHDMSFVASRSYASDVLLGARHCRGWHCVCQRGRPLRLLFTAAMAARRSPEHPAGRRQRFRADSAAHRSSARR